jgi:diguanylate cyclase (GGDEF)-like protein/PAS domain S-box-containing protein
MEHITQQTVGWFNNNGFLPHGHCYLWEPELLWTFVISDSIIALAYFSIPFGLMYFVNKRSDLQFNWVFKLFSVFIFACGMTHLLDVWTIWHPDYWLHAFTKVITATASLLSAILLWPLIPRAIKLPSVKQLESLNARLLAEIEQRKLYETELTTLKSRSDTNYRILFESSRDALLVLAPDGRFLSGNPAAIALFGCQSESEFMALTPAKVSPEFQSDGRRSDEQAQEMTRLALENGTHTFEWLHQRVNGEPFTAEVLLTRIELENQILLQASVRDITERKAAERKVAYLSRVRVVLSGINTLIVRVHDRNELFREACRIAVEHGGFRMSWIGMVDRNAMQIVPVASAGANEEILTAIKDLLSSSEGAPLGNTMSAQAIREKKAVVSDDVLSDPRAPLGKQHVKSGIRSLALLPLIVSDEAIGVLALYASEAGFFQEEEMQLLTELAGDIAFAIDHIEKQERLNYLAYYDVLTGLANRSLFLERVAQHMHRAVSGGHKLAIALIDLERFKNINDSLGRPSGDALLKQVTDWLTGITGDASLLARIDADHFAGVLPQVKHGGDLAHLLEKTMQAFLEHPFRLNNAEFRIAAKAGVALFPDDGTDADTLFRNAEAALKKAKASGERFLFYTQKMTKDVAGKLTLENQLRQAIENEEFVLHYQPKVNFESGKVTSAEALIRWNDPRTGLVPPGRFIPILEETGMIYEVGRWALRKASEDYLRWRAAGLPAVRIAVNVSPLQLRNLNFIDEIKQVLALDTNAAAGLELEITESVIMNDIEHNIANLQAIRALGITIAIDDFGTGFSSLSYLAKLPMDTLKIDRSFVIDMTAGPEGLALVSTIISLAHSLNLKVVAEGVETEEQSHLLRLLKCDEMQGYLFSKPVPAEIFETRFLAPPPVE